MQTQTNALPIGLFDSGVGGLTVLRAMQALMPFEDYLYLGDTARLPYGTKSQETIVRYAVQAAAHLMSRHIKLLVVACNTASAVALPALASAWPLVPVVGVVKPGARAAVKASASGRIAVIATESTVRGKAYGRAIRQLRPEAEVMEKACPLFVPLVEDGLVEGPLVEGIAARYLDSLFQTGQEARPDCLVLGCTHFPLMAAALSHVAGAGVTLVDSAATTAEEVERELHRQELATEKRTVGKTHFLTTDDVARFALMGSRFLGGPVSEENVELVDL